MVADDDDSISMYIAYSYKGEVLGWWKLVESVQYQQYNCSVNAELHILIWSVAVLHIVAVINLFPPDILYNCWEVAKEQGCLVTQVSTVHLDFLFVNLYIRSQNTFGIYLNVTASIRNEDHNCLFTWQKNPKTLHHHSTWTEGNIVCQPRTWTCGIILCFIFNHCVSEDVAWKWISSNAYVVSRLQHFTIRYVFLNRLRKLCLDFRCKLEQFVTQEFHKIGFVHSICLHARVCVCV